MQQFYTLLRYFTDTGTIALEQSHVSVDDAAQ